MPALSFPVQGTQIVRRVKASNGCYTPGMQFRSSVLLTGLILMGILLAQALPAPFGVTTIQQHTLFLLPGNDRGDSLEPFSYPGDRPDL